jgi:chromosome segregation ATPase
MVEAHMYFAMGFLLAALGLLAFIPLVHGRAVRLTRRRLAAMIPASAAEIMADKDLLRAEFAMSTRQLEIALGKVKAKSASDRAELGRKTDAVHRLMNELTALRARLTASEEKVAANPNAMPAADTATPAAASAQAEELAVLRLHVESLTKWLNDAGVEIRALRAEQKELETVREILAKERLKFRNFHRRAAELVDQLIKQAANDRSGIAGYRQPDAPAAHQTRSIDPNGLMEKPAA